MNLSVREREVLEIVGRCQAMGMHVLADHLEARMPADEVRIIVDSLKGKGLVVVMPGSRYNTVAWTTAGKRALEEARVG